MDDIRSLIAELHQKVFSESELQAQLSKTVSASELGLDPVPSHAQAWLADDTTPASIRGLLSDVTSTPEAGPSVAQEEKHDPAADTSLSLSSYLARVADDEMRTHMRAEILRILRMPAPSDMVAGDLVDLLGFDHLDLVQKIVDQRAETISEIEAGNVASNMGKKLTRREQLRQKQLMTEELSSSHLVMTAEDAQANIDRQREAMKSRELFDPNANVQVAETYPHVYSTAAQSSASFNRSSYILPYGTQRFNKKTYDEVIIPPPNLPAPRLDERILSIDELDPLCKNCFPGYKNLNRLQSVVFKTAYKSNENMLVCAPTGAGKTDVAVLSILRVVSQNLLSPMSSSSGSIKVNLKAWKVIYVAPMKALASEITRKFSKRLNWLGIHVRELTGDMQLTKKEIADTQIIVTTPEKWDVVTRKSTSVGELVSKVRLLLIDEVHLLNEERGAVIETIVARTLRQVESSQSVIRIVGLSATLPNYIDVADFLRVSRHRGMFYFDAAFRPVPLEQHFLGVKGKANSQMLKSGMDDAVYEKVLEMVRQGHQVMVFVHARKETIAAAKTIYDKARLEGDAAAFSPLEHSKYDLNLRDVLKSRNKEMKDLFTHGFGIHNAGMLRSDRNMMERMFEDGTIKVLCCTATLAWGVNLPAHAVIIKGTQVYSSEKGAFTDLSVLDVLQIFGRSGRPGYSTSGVAWLCTSHDKLENYIQAISMQHPIESRFISGIVDSLNAEINLGSVLTVAEAVQWIGYTYLYIRMRKNPLLYGMPHTEPVDDPLLGGKRLQVITSAAQTLRKAKMIHFDEIKGTFAIMDVGSVAARYYLRHTSIEIYNTMFHAAMSEADLLSMLCMSTEFDQIQVREIEVPELERLQKSYTQCQVKGRTHTNQGKVNILLQSSISRAFVEDFALISDSAYVVQNGSRIIRALLDIAMGKQWAHSSLTLISLSKAIEKRVWPFQNPLRQNSTISQELMFNLEEFGDDIEMLDLAKMDIKEVAQRIHINERHAQILIDAASHFPSFDCSIQTIPLSSKLVQIDVRLDQTFVWNTRVNGMSEQFWIWIENSTGTQILQLAHFTSRQGVMSTTLQFFISVISSLEEKLVRLRMVSDCWIGSDIEMDIPLSDIKMPECKSGNLLNPNLPFVSLDSTQTSYFGQILDPTITSLNAIQSDCFNTVAQTNDNFIISAPTGTGKFTLAQLAMSRALMNEETVRIIILTCRSSLASQYRKKLTQSFREVLTVDVHEAHNSSEFSDHIQIARTVVFVSSTTLWQYISAAGSELPEISLLVLMDLQDMKSIDELAITFLIQQYKTRVSRIAVFCRSIIFSQDVASWLSINSRNVHHYSPDQRPVSLRTNFIASKSGRRETSSVKMNIKPLFNLIVGCNPAQCAVFVSNISTCRLVAKELCTISNLSQGTSSFLNARSDTINAFVSGIRDQELADFVVQGVGIYDSKMDYRDLHLVAQLFAAGILGVCICSKESCWELPFSSSNVVVLGTSNPVRDKDGNFEMQRYSLSEMIQMQAIAAKTHDHLSAEVSIMTVAEDRLYYSSALMEGYPLESKILSDYSIISAAVMSLPELEKFFKSTYLAIRLESNSHYYDFQARSLGITRDTILDFLAEKKREEDDVNY